MSLIKRFAIYTVNYSFSLLMSFSLIYALISSLMFKHSAFAVFVFTAAILLVLEFIFFNKTTKIIASCFLGTSVLLLIAFILHNHCLTPIIDTFIDVFNWLYDYIDGSAQTNARFSEYITISLCVSITILVFIFTLKKFNFYILLAGGASLFTTQWMLDYFVSYAAFYIYLVVLLTYYFDFVNVSRSKKFKGGFSNSTAFKAWIFPVSLLVFLISFTLPPSDKPIEWKWLDEKINQAYNCFNNLNYNSQVLDYFTLSSTGFGSSDGKLGGKVKLDKTIVLKVNSPISNVYLRCSSKDTYTGSSWLASTKELLPLNSSDQRLNYNNYEMQEGIMLLAGMDNHFIQYLELFKEKPKKINITYQNMKTKSLFVPLRFENIDFKSGESVKSFQTDSDGSLVSEKALGMDFSYSVDLRNINYGDQELKSILKKSKKGFYNEILNSPGDKEFLEYRSQDNNSKVKTGIIRNFPGNAETIYSKYTQLPDTLPQRVKDLAADITGKQTNNYDKVKAIEQFLCNNFPYTLTPAKTPKKQDFVDYFLFNLKQGYCTYYASAMTVLVRSIGIPARYVEGYVLPPKPSEGTTYEVTNEQAHAWVEVYFEGFGWLPFEPTAPFTSAFYSNSSESSASYSSSFSQDPEYLQYMQMMQQYGHTGRMPDPEDMGNVENISKTNTYYKWIMTAAILSIVIAAFLITVLVNILRFRVQLLKIRKMPPKCSVLSAYKYYLKLLACNCLVIKDGETPSQFGGRVDSYISFRPVRFAALTDIFIRARYSNLPINASEKKAFLDFYHDAIPKMRQELGKLKFFICRYLLGRF